jgi:hypothetical protein
MNMNTFADKVKRGVTMKLEEDATVTVQKVIKNNGIVLHGLSIMKKDKQVSPTIYLESFLQQYEEGMLLSQIVRQILEMYEEGMPKLNMDLNFFLDFERVKNRISYKIVNAERNRELLKQIPHIVFLDLAICFFYPYFHKMLGNGSILIYNNHVDLWKTSCSDLYALAKVNTPKIFQPEYLSMKDLLVSYAELPEAAGKEFCLDVNMCVLSNKQRYLGAACMIYPTVLQQISRSFDKDFYVLPSSIHEVILLPGSVGGNHNELRAMVKEVNRTQLEPSEILSDSVYFYDHHTTHLKTI